MSENNDIFKCVNCEKRFPSEQKLKEHYTIEENLQKGKPVYGDWKDPKQRKRRGEYVN